VNDKVVTTWEQSSKMARCTFVGGYCAILAR
jgi:hypothetical protein